MIDKNGTMPIIQQCELLDMARSNVYYSPVESYSKSDYKIMEEIDQIYTDCPFYGHRRIYHELLNRGYQIGRDRVLNFMKIQGIEAIYPKPKTSIRNREHNVYPYLLNDISITKPNQVWSSDITYIPLKQGFCYMVAIIDLYSRKILSYRISNTMDVHFCLAALDEALRLYGKPDIFNTDQGSQFTSHSFTQLLLKNGISISMDSKGRALDNIFIERFWRSLKYENIYLNKYESMKEVQSGVKHYIWFYNHKRLHSSIGYRAPAQLFNINSVLKKMVA